MNAETINQIRTRMVEYLRDHRFAKSPAGKNSATSKTKDVPSVFCGYPA